jgi:hypothetical protein
MRAVFVVLLVICVCLGFINTECTDRLHECLDNSEKVLGTVCGATCFHLTIGCETCGDYAEQCKAKGLATATHTRLPKGLSITC